MLMLIVCMFVSVCLSVCLCLSVLIQLIIRKHIKVVSIYGLWPFWQPSSNKLVIFIISFIFPYILYVENKFFFFSFREIACVLRRGIGGDAADENQVPLSRRVGLVRGPDVLEGAAGVPARRRRAQGQVRAVGRDLAARRRRRRRVATAAVARVARVVGAAASPREATATRADPRHGSRLRRTLAQLLPRQRRPRQHRDPPSPVPPRSDRQRTRQLPLALLRPRLHHHRGTYVHTWSQCHWSEGCWSEVPVTAEKDRTTA